jgi:hypothetical protein
MKISIHSHCFEKVNPTTIIRGKKVYDRLKCTVCGLEGIRYGLDDVVIARRDKGCIKDTWVFSKERGEPVRLLPGEYKPHNE